MGKYFAMGSGRKWASAFPPHLSLRSNTASHPSSPRASPLSFATPHVHLRSKIGKAIVDHSRSQIREVQDHEEEDEDDDEDED
jgi:hypothetical protein